MLGQVGLLGVALPTVGADVGFKMLRLLMLGDMLKQGGFVMETFVAGVALVGFIRLVAPGVGLQVGQLRERFSATCNIFILKSFISLNIIMFGNIEYLEF